MAIRTYLTPEEIQDMIDKATNLRDQTILILLADCGCRVSELLTITPGNFDQEKRVIIIPHLKRGIKKHCPQCTHVSGKSTKFCSKCGNDLSKITATGIAERSRLVSIGKMAANALDQYIRAAKITDQDNKVFPISRQMVYYIVREAAESIGLRGKCILNSETNKRHYVHPHDFRTALATSWLKVSGGNINKQKALQSHLGHQSFETTMRYLSINPEDVKTVGDEVREARFG